MNLMFTDDVESETWYVVAYDELGETVEMTGSDPEELADRVASWAQQEEDRWPERGLLYMLVSESEFTR